MGNIPNGNERNIRAVLFTVHPVNLNTHLFTFYDWKFAVNLDFLGLDSIVKSFLKGFS